MAQKGRQEIGEIYWRVNVDEAKEMLDEGSSVVVDVRNIDEWTSGHVQGAIHIPVDDVISRANELPNDKNLLFICASGIRSGLACEMAAAMGIPQDNLYNVEDGTPSWISKNYPTE